MSKKILIVGGVAGGAGAAARSRRLDEKASITMFEKGPHVSFSNCGLPYHISGHIQDRDSLLMMTPELFASQYNIVAKTDHEVIKINGDKKTIIVRDILNNKDIEEAYDELIIASGCRAREFDIKGNDLMEHFSLKNVFDLDKIMEFLKTKKPKHITVVGGGYIGLEVAENFKLKGMEVSIVEINDQVMLSADFDMAQIMHKELLDKGIDLNVSVSIKEIQKGKIILNNDKEIKTDGIIFAAGIIPNSEFAKDSGVKVNDSNHIIVDDKFKTNLDNVYAVGDVIEVDNLISKEKTSIPLAGLANKQGRYVADSIYGKPVLKKGAIASSVVKVFDLTAATTGLNTKQIESMKRKVEFETVYLVPMTAVGIMPEAKPLHLKVLYDTKTKEILGAQALSKGYGAEKRIDIIATCIKGGQKITDLIDLELCYAPPYGTGKDAVNMVGYIASNLIAKDFKQILCSELQEELKKSNGLMVDVREECEFKTGHVIDSINIPMSQVRERLNEIPKDKNVYVSCRSGQRSYNVCLFLKTQGYKNVYNIAGSYIGISHYYDTVRKLYGKENILTKPNFN